MTAVWKNGTTNANIIARFAYGYAGKRLKAEEGNTETHYLYGLSGQLLSEVKSTTTASGPFKATGTDLQYVYALGYTGKSGREYRRW